MVGRDGIISKHGSSWCWRDASNGGAGYGWRRAQVDASRVGPCDSGVTASPWPLRIGREYSVMALEREDLQSDQRNDVSVLGRAVRVLSALATRDGGLGLAELSRATGLPKTTVYRLAAQLVELRLLERSGERYRLGVAVFEIGSSVRWQSRLREAALPFMADLYESTHETVHLGALSGLEVIYLEKIVGHRMAPVRTPVGIRRPLCCTAMGKAILAFQSNALLEAVTSAGLPECTPYTVRTRTALEVQLEDARQTGIAYDRQETALGVVCAAGPILSRGGVAVGALSVTGPAARLDLMRIAPAVRVAVLGLNRYLSEHPWLDPSS